MHNKRRYIIGSLSLLVGLLMAPATDAAMLSLVPSKTQVSVGDTFRIKLSVNTEGAAVNNAEGIIHFPAGTVSVLSVDNSGSVFGLWPEQATFSNSGGTVSFNGGVVNPGYTGKDGQVVSILAKALKPGSAQFSLTGSYVRANDGYGTDVLSGKNSATVTILPAAEPIETPVATPTTVVPATVTDTMLPGLVLSSSTNPDQTRWYRSNKISVSWENPEGSKGTQYVFGGPPGTVPTGAVSSLTKKEYASVRDGASYFHARYKTAAGWSAVSTYVFHIDTLAPDSLTAAVETQGDGSLKMVIRGADATSGIDHFVVQIGDETPVRVQSVNDGAEYDIPSIPYLGTYESTVTAVDKAGNTKEVSVPIVVRSLAAPTLTDFPAEIVVGKPITISGNAIFSDRQIMIYVKLPDNKLEQYLVESDSTGAFTLVTEDTRLVGYHEMWAQFVNERGERSYESFHVKTLVVASGWYRLLRFIAHNALTLGLAFFALIGILFVIFRIRYHIVAYREKKRAAPVRVS